MYRIFLIIFASSYAKLETLAPFQFSIRYSLTNFGNIPWERQLIGQIYAANPLDGCDLGTPPVNNLLKQPFILVKGGGCSYVTKVRNCQAWGASLVLIMDDTIKQTGNIVMSNDGYGHTVTIPSIFIEEFYGYLIQDFIGDQTTKNESLREFDKYGQRNIISRDDESRRKRHIILGMSFDVINPQKTLVIFALKFQSRESYQLVRKFHMFYNLLKNENVVFQVLYHQFTSPSGSDYDFRYPEKNCLGGGLYCVADVDQKNDTRYLIEEQLRQICLFQYDPDRWWLYFTVFDRKCIVPQEIEQCSRELMINQKINYKKVDQCVSKSFNTSSSSERTLQRNSVLEEQKKILETSGLMFFPGALINNREYEGAIDAKDIFREICNNMIKQPSQCQLSLAQDQSKTTEVSPYINFDEAKEIKQIN